MSNNFKELIDAYIEQGKERHAELFEQISYDFSDIGTTALVFFIDKETGLPRMRHIPHEELVKDRS